MDYSGSAYNTLMSIDQGLAALQDTATTIGKLDVVIVGVLFASMIIASVTLILTLIMLIRQRG